MLRNYIRKALDENDYKAAALGIDVLVSDENGVKRNAIQIQIFDGIQQFDYCKYYKIVEGEERHYKALLSDC